MNHRNYSKRLTRLHYELLAALVLADGEYVARGDLAGLLYRWPVAPTWVSRRVTDLERFGVTQIERRYRVGYRLTALPPDEHLESMLACVPAVKQSRWWTRRTAWERAS